MYGKPGGSILFFTEEKIARRIQELQSRRYINMENIAPMEAMEGTNGCDEVYTHVPEHFNGRPLPWANVSAVGINFCGCAKKSCFRKANQAAKCSAYLTLGKPTAISTVVLSPCYTSTVIPIRQLTRTTAMSCLSPLPEKKSR